MPRSATDPAKERVKLILEWEKRWDAGEGVTNISELCREFGISRETAYVWRPSPAVPVRPAVPWPSPAVPGRPRPGAVALQVTGTTARRRRAVSAAAPRG
ncbi:MAG TPA: hypothetical protein VHE35_13300 [Kofleriaceae bacterium]|nr:hypothetical protein [Kofleriaceae bacterium]